MLMGISFNWLIKILATVLSPMISILTPMIKEALVAFLTDLFKKALVTENPFDDFFIGLLLDVLGIPRPLSP